MRGVREKEAAQEEARERANEERAQVELLGLLDEKNGSCKNRIWSGGSGGLSGAQLKAIRKKGKELIRHEEEETKMAKMGGVEAQEMMDRRIMMREEI